jgi:hypothetical protein
MASDVTVELFWKSPHLDLLHPLNSIVLTVHFHPIVIDFVNPHDAAKEETEDG